MEGAVRDSHDDLYTLQVDETALEGHYRVRTSRCCVCMESARHLWPQLTLELQWVPGYVRCANKHSTCGKCAMRLAVLNRQMACPLCRERMPVSDRTIDFLLQEVQQRLRGQEEDHYRQMLLLQQQQQPF